MSYLIKHHAMKIYWGSGVIAPRILNLSTRYNIPTTSHDIRIGTETKDNTSKYQPVSKLGKGS
jgi:hypothetical protein